MLNVFVSLRCEGKNFDEMKEVQNNIFKKYTEKSTKYKDEFYLIESLIPTYVPGESNRIEYLGKSIEKMKDADVVLVPLDYKKSKGCFAEAMISKMYGLTIVTYLLDNRTNVFFLDGLVETF